MGVGDRRLLSFVKPRKMGYRGEGSSVFVTRLLCPLRELIKSVRKQGDFKFPLTIWTFDF